MFEANSPRSSRALTGFVSAAPAWLVLLITAAAAGGSVLAIGLLARAAGVGFSDLSRDTTSVAGAPFYVGALSTLGVLVWWGGGSACLLGAAVLGRRAPGDPRRLFLLVTGWLTLWLAFDDMFQIHEHVIPVYAGIDERWILALYGLAALAWAVVFRRVILGTEFSILLGAAACFLISVAMDVTVATMPMQHLIEDGGKLVGIALWSVYLVRTSLAWAAATAPAIAIGPPRAAARSRPSWVLARS